MTFRRRSFITLLGGAAAWPLGAGAQGRKRVRRIGVLMGLDENNPVEKTYLSAFTQALADLGWTDGRNVRIDLRWGASDANRIRALARELVGLQPDIIMTDSTPATAAHLADHILIGRPVQQQAGEPRRHVALVRHGQ
jgi:putative ABC transport system substrate-binding protein